MSIKLMSQVWECDLPNELKFLALALADHADDDGNRVYPSVPLLAAKCAVTDRTVQRNLKTLRDMGVLEVVRRGGGRGRTTEYRLSLKGVTASPFFLERVTSAHRKGDTDDTNGDAHVTRTIKEPSSTEPPASRPSEQTIEALKDRAAAALAPPDDRIEQWNAVEKTCLASLQEMHPVWAQLTWGGMKKLAQDYGHQVLTYALQRAWETRTAPVRPYPYMRSLCGSIAQEIVDEGGALGEGVLPSSAQGNT